MKIAKILIAFLIISLSFTACSKKNKEEAPAKNTKKVEKKADAKKEVKKEEKKSNNKKLTIKKSKATQEQIDKLSEIFAFGDKLVKERSGYQHEIAVLSPELKKMKTPFKLKGNHKYVVYSYFSNSVWATIYPDEASMKSRKNYTFWIIITYKHSIDDKGRKSYRDKFIGYPATRFKDAWAWILLKDDIEVKVTTNTKVKEVRSDKAIEKIFKDIDLKGIEHIFDKKTKYPELKEYFLKIKAINAKINAVNAKFTEKEKEGVEAIKPFITQEGILKDLDLSNIKYYNSNTFSISAKKDKKYVFTLTIGRPGVLGLLSFLKDKNLKKSKIGGFEMTTLKNTMAMLKLPKLSIKASAFYKTEYQDAEKLKEAIVSLDIEGLSKVK